MAPAEPVVGADLTAEEFEQIVKACDDFEAQWQRGDRPRIEEFLARHHQLSRAALLRELLALELELAGAAGKALAPGDYRGRFPDDLEVVDAVLAEIGTFDAGATVDQSAKNDFSPLRPVALPSAPAPAKIGRYTVVSLIDEGGQGRIFRVVHPGLGKDLVLKLAAGRALYDPAGRELLASEARLLAELNHPNLVRVFDLDVDDVGRPFLVMEHVAGCTLDRYVENNLPSPRKAAALLAEIARAVAYVHSQGIVHQDIKPRNILIDQTGRPRLIDFGLARLRHAWADDASGPSGGTLMFMAPEQARGEVERVGPAADIYALGGLLYFLFTGRSPVGTGTRPELYERARRGAVDVAALTASRAPRRLRQICLKALSADPAGRYATADALASQLERVALRPWRAAIGVVGALMMVAAIAAIVYSRSRAPAPIAATPVDERQELVHLEGNGPRSLAEMVPLRDGDRLWVSCRVPHGASATMFWLDSEGSLTELTPEVDLGALTDTLCYPPKAPASVVALEGHPGTELVLICAGSGKPVSRQEIEAILGAGRRLPALPDRVALRLGSEGVEAVARSVSRSISGPVESELSGALGPLRMLQSKLRDRTTFLAGAAFPHVAK